MEYCVYKQSCQEQAIHNFLLSLYSRYKQDEVMSYISSQGSEFSFLLQFLCLKHCFSLFCLGQDISMVHYDVHYGLRLCQEAKLTEACVQLSALLGLWAAAVDLALTINVDLAKQIAAMPSDSDNELRKKLWLKIGNIFYILIHHDLQVINKSHNILLAEHVVKEKDDIQQAMDFLQQCDLVRIEDILPFFSDFVTIDHFKNAICTSLQV